MPYQLDRDGLKARIDEIVDWAEAQPVPSDVADQAIVEGPELVEIVYIAWLASCLTYGVHRAILDHLDEFIIPV